MRSNRGGDIDLSSSLCYNNVDMRKVKLLSVEETAELLRASRSTIYKFINSGELKAIKLDSRTMIKMADLTDFVDTREKYRSCPNEV